MSIFDKLKKASEEKSKDNGHDGKQPPMGKDGKPMMPPDAK